MPFTPEQVAELRTLLVTHRSRVVTTANQEDDEAAALASENTRPMEYEEAAQKASTSYALHRLSDGQRDEVAQIDRALARMNAGIYGKCDACGDEIGYDRLKALPHTNLCGADAQRRDRPPRSLLESTKI